MKKLSYIVLGALLVVGASVFAADSGGPFYDAPPGGGGVDGTAISPTTITASGLITANGGVALGASQDLTCVDATGATCIFDEQGGTCGTRTDDANSVNRTINSSDVWPFAATAKTAGNVIIRGGLDSKTITCAVATCDATDTVIITRTINGTSTANTLVFGTDFCIGGSCTTNDLMAASLAAAVESLTGVGATTSSAVVGFTADRLTSTLVPTDSNAHAACTVISTGTNGGVVIEGPNFSVTSAGLIGSQGGLAVGNAAISTYGAFIGYSGASELQTSVFGVTPGTANDATSADGARHNVRTYGLRVNITNAMIVALGAVGTGDISLTTIPAKTIVRNVNYIIDTACTLAAGALTVSVGRTGANYDDYIVDSDAKAAANTVYGNDTAERGTNLTSYDLPSYTGTTTFYAHFEAGGGGTLNNVTTCTGHVNFQLELAL